MLFLYFWGGELSKIDYLPYVIICVWFRRTLAMPRWRHYGAVRCRAPPLAGTLTSPSGAFFTIRTIGYLIII
jgi:hypothetical protein